MTEENSFPRCDRRKVLFRQPKFHTLPTCNRAVSILQPMSETWRISVSAVSPRSCRGTCLVEIAHLAFLCAFSWRHLYALCGENGALRTSILYHHSARFPYRSSPAPFPPEALHVQIPHPARGLQTKQRIPEQPKNVAEQWPGDGRAMPAARCGECAPDYYILSALPPWRFDVSMFLRSSSCCGFSNS